MPTLAYWKTRGLAQPIRFLLTYAGEEFEDVQYEQGDAPELSRAAWTDVKPSFNDILDFPNLPYYIDGDVKITQSNAILKHVARKHKLDGTNDTEKAYVDFMLDQAMDLRNGVVRLCYNKDYESLKEDYFKNVQPTLALFEKKLGNNDWFVGNKPTVADFPMYELLDQHLRMKADSLDACPKLKAFLQRFSQLPKVKEYLAQDKVKNMPINNKSAAFK
ncbi:glutathione S-transferase Mu 5-like isoform X3 [Mya arenaria]|uniref:glutathione S-transferase Mu 5-like isoform X3 n=1 Tax=Mya arenaria TaxID=6604 RepID=UPI0022E85CF0|nr:glutathione S-transferase Mu 5-like isoform X3 [Mya arenaria]